MLSGSRRNSMAIVVYILCSLMSSVCALLLLRAYWSKKSNLLLWNALCFVGFAINNILLVVDLELGPEYDLSSLRGGVTLASVGILLYGLIWDTI